jgi:hypothetical protein
MPEILRRCYFLQPSEKFVLFELISWAAIAGDLKMRVTFPEAGRGIYLMIQKKSDGSVKELTTTAAAILLRELLKSSPAGRRLSPGF